MMRTNTNEEEDPEQPPSQQQQQEQIASSSAGRFPKWIALAVLSLVAWLATIGGVTRHQMDRPEKWALTATTLSLVFATLGVLCYFFGRGMFMGQLPEVVLAGVIIIIWAGGLPVIMNPANSIAVGYTDYLNANLYFGSWLTFFVSIWIAGDLAKEMYGMDIVGMVSPHVKARRGKWYALIATSLIVMSSSVRVFRAFPCSADIMTKSPTCRQTKFAISAGVIGTLFSMGATLYTARGKFSHRSDWISSAVMVIIWSFGLGYITFGSGPGQNIGNLYFATWGSFTLSVLLAAESVREYLSIREQTAGGGMNGGDDSSDDPAAPGIQPVPVASQSFEDADL